MDERNYKKEKLIRLLIMDSWRKSYYGAEDHTTN